MASSEVVNAKSAMSNLVVPVYILGDRSFKFSVNQELPFCTKQKTDLLPVENAGIEPATSCMLSTRSAN